MKATGQVDTVAPSGSLAGVEFFLEGEMTSLSASTSRAQTDYMVVRFQLTNATTGLVVWSNSWEVKKEGSWGVMYQ
jgi:PBP1b-binding outer membrane lipoprotein LpoB